MLEVEQEEAVEYVDDGWKEGTKKELQWLQFLGVSFHSNKSGTVIKVRGAAAVSLFTGV